MAQIGTLSVQFKSSAKVLEKTLASLTSQLNKFHAATNNTSLVRVVNETKQLGVAAEKAAKKTGSFGSSLMRIAKYRLLRTILKEITQAFREGVTNLYEYSTALNSTDAAANKSTMDQYASSLLYLKNAAGAAAGPLLQALLPVVQQLVDWFVAGANAVNQFISALQGKTTFTKAVYNMTEFGKQTEKAGAAAKELKKTIFGWDELNILEDNSKGSGGGGGASTPDYSEMFKEEDISSGIKKVADFVKPLVDYISDHMTEILTVVGAIGTAMLAWKITKGVIDFFTNIGKLTSGGISAIGTVFGGAFGGIATGATLAATAVGLFWWHMEEGRKKWESSKEYAELQESLKAIQTNAEEARTAYKDFTNDVDAWAEKLQELEIAKDLIEKIFEIYNKPAKDDSEIALMIGYIETLNGLGLEGITLEYDTLTGEISKTKEEILNVVEALDEQYKMQAKKELLIKAYKTQFTLEDRLRKIEAKRAENVEKLNAAEAEFKKNNPNGTVDIGGFTLGMVGGESGWFGTETGWDNEAASRVDDYRSAIEEADVAIEEINADLAGVNQTITYLNHNDFSKVFDDGAKSARNASNAIGTGTEEINKYNDATKGARKSAVGFADENERIGGIKLDLSDEEMDEFKDATDDATKSTSNYKNELSDTRQKVVNLRSTTDIFGNQIDKYGNTIDTATGKTKNFGTTVKNIDGNLVNAKGDVIQLHDSMQKLVSMRAENNGASGITKEVADNLKNARDYAATLYTNLTNVEGVKMTTFVSKLIEARNALYDAKVYAYNLYDGLNKASKYKLRKMDQYALNNAYVEYDPTFTYASGGWPSAGELFVAREAGPEMVGTINGSTAVATNGDIVAAVSQGVAQAVAGVMGSGSGDMNISIQVGEYELANAVVSALNAQTRRIGYSQLEGI